MPKVNIERKHSLPVDEVRRRLDALSARLADKYGIDSKWVSASEAQFKRTGATGSLVCHPDKVTVALDLSFALSPLKGQVEERITRELEKALA